MDRKVFSELVSILDDYDWFIFSGVAVKLYGVEERGFNDIDIAVKDSDIDDLAERLGVEVEDRDFIKEGNRIQDRAFETDFKGIEIEATSGFNDERMQEGSFDKLFELSEEKDFLGETVKVEPFEELLVHKAKMARDKDIRDLESLNREVDEELLREIIGDWSLEEERVLSTLRKTGFDI
ncbi:MAG: hypothetical protein ABEJ99_05530 [Candidatus Nanohaloarchaea archaeon]